MKSKKITNVTFVVDYFLLQEIWKDTSLKFIKAKKWIGEYLNCDLPIRTHSLQERPRVGLWKIFVITLIKENSISIPKDFQKNVYYLPTTNIYVYKMCNHLLTKNLLFGQISNLTGSLSKVSLKINSKNQKIIKSRDAIIVYYLLSLDWLISQSFS